MPVPKSRIWHRAWQRGDPKTCLRCSPRLCTPCVTGGVALALLLSPSRGGDAALPGRIAGSQSQSAVAQGHLCWLPMPSVRGEVGGEPAAIPPTRVSEQGDSREWEGGTTRTPDSLHPRVLALPPAPGGRKRRGWRQPPQVSSEVSLPQGWGDPFSGVPGVGGTGCTPVHLDGCSTTLPTASACPLVHGSRAGPRLSCVFGGLSDPDPPHTVHMAEHGGGGVPSPPAQDCPGFGRGVSQGMQPLSSPRSLLAGRGAGAGSHLPSCSCWWQPPSPHPSLLSSGGILRAPGHSRSPPCVWNYTTPGAGHRQVHSRNPHRRCGNRCPASRGRRPLMRR